MRFSTGQSYTEDGLMSEPDEQRLFTEACLHGLQARLCNDVDAVPAEHPEVGWEQLRTVEKGRRSPLAALAKQAAPA
ncbi:hypothetical protein ACF07T_38370 [Streptomyces sp. NPDC015184]|uniref:hypothetical protein n=1 Tax=Streptomyces sp. NPDC015184 TaxID=3364946 RepID=UPI0036FE4C7C